VFAKADILANKVRALAIATVCFFISKYSLTGWENITDGI
jgi:hypothetical protein